MTQSPELTALSAALLKAQKEMKNPGFDALNPHFKSRYASLVSVRAAVLPALHKHGLVLTQCPIVSGDTAGISWRLLHGETGQWLAGEVLLPLDKKNAHGVGSAVTYATRYTMQSLGAVVGDEDDDGNGSLEAPIKPVVASKPNTGPDIIQQLKDRLKTNLPLAEDYFRYGSDKSGKALGWLAPDEGIESLALNHARKILENFDAFVSAVENYSKNK